jgi:hypothetical protein
VCFSDVAILMVEAKEILWKFIPTRKFFLARYKKMKKKKKNFNIVRKEKAFINGKSKSCAGVEEKQ